MRDPLVISGQDLTVDDIAAVAQGRPVDIHPDSIPRMDRSRQAVERLVADGRIAYGITTGFLCSPGMDSLGSFRFQVCGLPEILYS